MRFVKPFFSFVSLGLCLSVCVAFAAPTSVSVQDSPKNITTKDQPGRSEAQKAEPAKDSGKFQNGLESRTHEARERLAKLKAIFKHGTSAAFNKLNGKDSTNNAGQRLDEVDLKSVSDPDNGISEVRCIEEGKFVVTGTGHDVGKDANVLWIDASGQPVLTKIVGSLGGGNQSSQVTYATAYKNPTGGASSMITKTVVAVSSAFLLGQKNTGKKFLCYIEVEH